MTAGWQDVVPSGSGESTSPPLRTIPERTTVQCAFHVGASRRMKHRS